MKLFPYQQRVINEKTEIEQRLINLVRFLDSDEFRSSVSPDEKGRMMRQADVMRKYAEVLGERIDAFKGRDGEKAGEIPRNPSIEEWKKLQGGENDETKAA